MRQCHINTGIIFNPSTFISDVLPFHSYAAVTEATCTKKKCNASWTPLWLNRNLWFHYLNDTVRMTTNSSCLVCQGYRYIYCHLSCSPMMAHAGLTIANRPVSPPDYVTGRAPKQTQWTFNNTLFRTCSDMPFYTPAPSIPASGTILVAPNATFTCSTILMVMYPLQCIHYITVASDVLWLIMVVFVAWLVTLVYSSPITLLTMVLFPKL